MWLLQVLHDLHPVTLPVLCEQCVLRPHRQAQRRAHACGSACQAGGLARLVLDATKACATVVAALHALVAQTRSLVDLSVMDGSSLPVLQLNGVEPVESIDVHVAGKPHGPVSAAVIAACVRVNRALVELRCASVRSCRDGVIAPAAPRC